MDDIAQVTSTFIFRWDFDITLLSRDDRIWSVPEILALVEAYGRENAGGLFQIENNQFQ